MADWLVLSQWKDPGSKHRQVPRLKEAQEAETKQQPSYFNLVVPQGTRLHAIPQAECHVPCILNDLKLTLMVIVVLTRGLR